MLKFIRHKVSGQGYKHKEAVLGKVIIYYF